MAGPSSPDSPPQVDAAPAEVAGNVLTVAVEASKWGEVREDEHGGRRRDVERFTEQYAVPVPIDALARFAAQHPEVVAAPLSWHLRAFTPGAGPEPQRRLMNWERDPMVDGSDGWLSNIAAAGNNLGDQLEWQPEYCTHAHREKPCPACGVALLERNGKYGAFFTCQCGFKTGANTKKGRAADANASITGWCGATLVVRYNHLGVPYAGCPACNPDYKSPTVQDVYYGGAA